MGMKVKRRSMVHFFIVMTLMATALERIQPNTSKVHATMSEAKVTEKQKEPTDGKDNVKVKEKENKQEQTEVHPEFAYDRKWTADEEYLLAKIAMAEAEGESMRTKTLVILTVLNRVHSTQFDNTIEKVIFTERNGVYQFSPVMPGGRWWTTEPNEECYRAVQVVKEFAHDYSGGALYFESCNNKDNWHSRNLTFLYQSDNLRFYK